MVPSTEPVISDEEMNYGPYKTEWQSGYKKYLHRIGLDEFPDCPR